MFKNGDLQNEYLKILGFSEGDVIIADINRHLSQKYENVSKIIRIQRISIYDMDDTRPRHRVELPLYHVVYSGIVIDKNGEVIESGCWNTIDNIGFANIRLFDAERDKDAILLKYYSV